MTLLSPSSAAQPRPRRWTVDEYYRMGELGWFDAQRVEKALREQKMTVDESRVLLRFYESGLEGYTYLE